jgi:hypothetical protein
MKHLLPLVIAVFPVAGAWAETAVSQPQDSLFVEMDEISLDDFKWKKRPVVVFADSELDPAFETQMLLLRERQEELRARDVVVIVDTEPEPISDLRRKLRPRGFMLVLMSKDGTVNVRKPFPWDVREITRSIDKMPIRKREIKEQRLLNDNS